MRKTSDHTLVPASPAEWVARLEEALFVKQQAVTATPVKKLLASAAQQLQTAPDAAVAAFVSAAIPLCKKLHAQGRNGDALPLARLCDSLAARVHSAHYPRLHWQALTATGILLAHQGDYRAAIAEHTRALQLAEAAAHAGDQALTWNNVGSVFKFTSAHSLAIDCFMRAYQQYSLGPVFARYCALINMAHCQLQLGQLRQGRAAAMLALRYETKDFRQQDPYIAVVLRNNLVRLLVAAGKKETALPIAEDAYRLAAAAPSLLMNNLVNVLRAMLDVAYGRVDSGIARLEAELQQVRHLPEPRNDTLTALIEAAQAAGRTLQALIYWRELNDHTKPDALAEHSPAINGIHGISATGAPVKLELEEYQLLQWLAEGHSSKSIARLRANSDHNIRSYLSRVYAKIGVSNGRAAVAWLLTQRPAADLAVPGLPQATSSSRSAAHKTAEPIGASCDWYLRSFLQGSCDTAIHHWQATFAPERPAEARYAVALMLLLQSRTGEAMTEARLLKDTALRGVQWTEQWLANRSQDNLRRLQELAKALPAGHPDKYATLLVIYHGAMRAKAQDKDLAIDSLRALLEATPALWQAAIGHT